MDLNNKYQNMSSDSDSKSSSLNSKVEQEESVSYNVCLFKYKLPYYYGYQNMCLYKYDFTVNNCLISIFACTFLYFTL